MNTQNPATNQQTSIFPFISNLNEYENLEKIGSGTYGEVSKARCIRTKRMIALKRILIPKEQEVEGFPVMALREIQILQSLIYENVVQLIGMCRSSRDNSFRSDFYLVFEYCEYDLSTIISDSSIKLTLEHKRCIMKQILDGVYFLHHNTIIHRDLKPANILVTSDGIVKLADFGLSTTLKLLEYGQQNQHPTEVVTLWYRAPELLLGEQNYDFAIDMWSVGCIFAELWTRTAIVQGKNDQEQLALIYKLFGVIQWPDIRHLPRYSQIYLSEWDNLGLAHYMKDYKIYILEPCILDLINRLLTLDPRERINVDNAVKLSVFKPEPSSECLKVLLPNHSSMFESTTLLHNRDCQQNLRNVAFEPIY